jgi:alpha-beta hydrolase superfamily lysophospholipase
MENPLEENMKTAHFTHKASDGKSIYVRLWLPLAEPRALVLIAHGMAEHGARYERFAEQLTAKGYAVYVPDDRGHGKTAETSAELGYLADKEGFRRVIDDDHEIAAIALEAYPGVPLFLFGHSMGSFVAQGYIALYGENLSGCVLSGTSGPMPAAMLGGGKAVAAIGCLFKGRHALAPLANRLSFGSYNDAFKPTRTEFDWLSRDPAEVDKYVADPLCGFVCTYGFFKDFLAGLSFIHKPEVMARIPKSLPLFLVAGSADPVGAASGSVDALAATYRKLGIKRVDEKLYEGAHHEILNETNRDEVMADIVGWLEERRKAAK